MNKYLEGGKIINTHGVKGVLKIEPWSDTTKSLSTITKIFIRENDGFTQYNVSSFSPSGKFALILLNEFSDPESASVLKNKIFYVDRDELVVKDGSFFIDDLIGLNVIDLDTGKVYGKITDVYKDRRYDTYEIKAVDGKTVLLPAVKEFVKNIELDKGVFVTPIKGFFDED